jgi:HEAT repeat protein
LTSPNPGKRQRQGKRDLCPFLKPLAIRTGTELLLRDLERRGIKSHASLRNKLDSLPERQLATAIWALGQVGNRNDVPKLLKIRRARPTLAVEVLEALSSLGGNRALKELTRSLRDKTLPLSVRIEACYGLAHRWTGKLPTSIFYPIVSSTEEEPSLRGYAAEGIGTRVGRRRTGEARKAVEVLLPCLDDHSAEVRFWVVFALAGLDAKQALPKLRRLVRHDHANGPFGWSVSEEAKDAIYCLTKGRWPEIDASVRKDRRASAQVTS